MSKKKKGESGMAQRGRGIARWRMVRRTRKHSKRERERKRHQENVQNLKRSMVGHRDRKSRYT